MKNAFESIALKLDTDIRESCDFQANEDILFGTRSTPCETYPNATAMFMPVARKSGGARSVDEDWEIVIEVQVPKERASEHGAFALKIELADALTQRLAPFLETDTLPSPFPSVPPYAGIGWKPWVSKFDPCHDLDSSACWTFRLHFLLETTVHQ